MMNLLKKLFTKKNINPRYLILSNALERSKYRFSIERAFYIGGFEYKEENYQATLETLRTDLDSELAKLRYNAQADNIELYIIENEIGSKYIIFLYDPVELYHPEKVLDVKQVGNDLLPSNPEQIYP